MQVDAAIFGGGSAGLWLLDELVRRGHSAVLLEATALGSGQTVASQGILHGGLKYTLQGKLTGSAIGIREMPAIWRNCLTGNSQPNLTETKVRSPHCYLWRTSSLTSKLGMIGAKIGLRVAPKIIENEQRPVPLANCPGTVAILDEPVIAPDSLIANFANRHRSRLLQIPDENSYEFERCAPGKIQAIHLNQPATGKTLRLDPTTVIFTAGAGNAGLREKAGLTTPAMQKRPLHMVLLRGAMPELNGHCVDGRKTRVTITSDTDTQNRRIWQIGGQVSEQGVNMTEAELIAHTRKELQLAIPGVDLTNTEWSTYRVDRAEGITRNNRRPETVRILHEGNTITAWPTKLVLVPQLACNIAEAIANNITSPCSSPLDENTLADWPKPSVAKPPWETDRNWVADAEFSRHENAA
jgi:glycerol-3-phosphate dehydrogenase